ncbi:MAG: metal-sensing transcriptional repressor [Clostridia bacterium]|nr:metal-sensing transcriptional repressor [Clostridia bacterium]
MKEKECCFCHTEKKRDDGEYKSLINRLSRIEGQVRGIKGMVEKNAYCPDILMQVSAISSALNAFCKELLSNHIKTCVVNDIKNGNDLVVEELVTVVEKLMR